MVNKSIKYVILGMVCVGAMSACMSTNDALVQKSANDINWDDIPESNITLFYPGQATHEWLRGSNHPGADAVKASESCNRCHTGTEQQMGDNIVGGGLLEPTPIKGKRGSLVVNIKAAHDDEYLYITARWPSKEAGRYHDYIMYREGKWEKYGSHQLATAVLEDKQPAVYEDRFSMMFGDESLPEFKTNGCFLACHNDMRFMPDSPTKAQVKAHPVLGDGGHHKKDIRKYLLPTRTESDETGGWSNLKSTEELDKLKKQGTLLDLMQARMHRSIPVGMADDGYVSYYRFGDAGKKMFSTNWDKEKKQPKYMFDPTANNGMPHLLKKDIKNPDSLYYLGDENKVLYDPNYSWKNGDVLLRRVLTKDVEGSAGDNKNTTAEWSNGYWNLQWKRPLSTGYADDVQMVSGKTYPMGLSIHDNSATARFHFVSLPLLLNLGVARAGSINVVKVE